MTPAASSPSCRATLLVASLLPCFDTGWIGTSARALLYLSSSSAASTSFSPSPHISLFLNRTNMSLSMNARRRTSPQPFLAKSHVALNGGHLVPPVASPCQIRSAQSSISTLAPSPCQVPGAAAAPCIAPRSLPPSATRGRRRHGLSSPPASAHVLGWIHRPRQVPQALTSPRLLPLRCSRERAALKPRAAPLLRSSRG
ncbi:uncharacterized protein [Triticum aestivum]|uniref:uncharacterized protein n=1 Tax=Triticum aestivum TaxID=4565 RepID=UPI001D0310B3|nr:uncharacterized protein LOC123144507 [Triticum aestivum]